MFSAFSIRLFSDLIFGPVASLMRGCELMDYARQMWIDVRASIHNKVEPASGSGRSHIGSGCLWFRVKTREGGFIRFVPLVMVALRMDEILDLGLVP